MYHSRREMAYWCTAARLPLLICVCPLYCRTFLFCKDSLTNIKMTLKVFRHLKFGDLKPMCHLQATPLLDRIVFSKIKERLGGRVRIIVSGGAPLATHVEEFLKVTMCAPVVQGYGLTETCAGSFISIPGFNVSP